MVDYTGWFSNTNLTLHTWNKPYLVMSYNSFYLLLNYIVANILKVILPLCSWETLVYCFILSLSSIYIRIMLASLFPLFWKRLCRSGVYSSLNIWQDSLTKDLDLEISFFGVLTMSLLGKLWNFAFLCSNCAILSNKSNF